MKPDLESTLNGVTITHYNSGGRIWVSWSDVKTFIDDLTREYDKAKNLQDKL